MKAIGIKMVELQPMRASMALSTGYKIGNAHPDDRVMKLLIQMDIKVGHRKM